jgi:hypothetical protein
MKKSYAHYFLYLIIACCSVVIASCKKDKQPSEPVITNYATLGLYQRSTVDNGTTYKRIFMPVKIGTSTERYGAIFDTGSTGLTIDAKDILPADMITPNGLVITGDSTTKNGITVYAGERIIAFGGGASSETREYGNLAYTNITLGDGNGNVTVTRMPIFIYYKIVDVTNNVNLPAHSADVFGVGPGESYASNKIASPLSYFKLPAGVTNGFKLALLNGPFSLSPLPANYVPGLLTIGLTPTDLNSSGFIMHNLDYYSVGGYSPNIRASITYNGKTVNNAFLLFDTGDPAITYLSDPTATANVTTLPVNTPVSLTTNNGFSYQYTTASSSNVTQIIKTSYSGDIRSIFSIDFFVNNQYLLDYQNHRIGLKNN